MVIQLNTCSDNTTLPLQQPLLCAEHKKLLNSNVRTLPIILFWQSDTLRNNPLDKSRHLPVPQPQRPAQDVDYRPIRVAGHNAQPLSRPAAIALRLATLPGSAIADCYNRSLLLPKPSQPRKTQIRTP